MAFYDILDHYKHFKWLVTKETKNLDKMQNSDRKNMEI